MLQLSDIFTFIKPCWDRRGWAAASSQYHMHLQSQHSGLNLRSRKFKLECRSASHQSSQRVPSPAQVVQEHVESGQHQVEDWKLEDEATTEGQSAVRDREALPGARGHHNKVGSGPAGRSKETLHWQGKSKASRASVDSWHPSPTRGEARAFTCANIHAT
jgi:hypothetical protein